MVCTHTHLYTHQRTIEISQAPAVGLRDFFLIILDGKLLRCSVCVCSTLDLYTMCVCVLKTADMLIAMPTTFAIFGLVKLFNVSTFDGDSLAPFLLTIVLYSFDHNTHFIYRLYACMHTHTLHTKVLAILPFSYLFSLLFSSPDRAQTVTSSLYMVLGLILVIVNYALEQEYKDLSKKLQIIYRLFPTFLMSSNLLNLAILPITSTDDSPWKWDITGQNLIWLGIESVAYIVILLCVECLAAFPAILAKLGFTIDVPDQV